MNRLIMDCRPGCAACCIDISINSPLPGMAEGKPAGVRCVNLDKENRCRLHETPDYPELCLAFTPTLEYCGESDEQARLNLGRLELETSGA